MRLASERIECTQRARKENVCVCILFNVVLFHFSNDDFHSFSSKKITYMEIFACTRRVNAKACRKGFPVALIAGANQMECHNKN